MRGAELLPATTVAPEQGTIAFAEAINAADLDAAACCFTRNACLVTPDSTAIEGRENVRPILAQWISRQAQIEIQARTVLVAGETALSSERWLVRSAGTEGGVFEQVSTCRLVLSYLEGVWKLAIAAPWGLQRP